VISSDDGHALRVANQLQSGAVHVNSSSIGDEPHVPFGGIGYSGFGRLGGMESVRSFTEQRTLYLHGNQLGVSMVKD
jgi:acyl-CoA reductase-like NAD-dependent aldehyde dehydrogenase